MHPDVPGADSTEPVDAADNPPPEESGPALGDFKRLTTAPAIFSTSTADKPDTSVEVLVEVEAPPSAGGETTPVVQAGMHGWQRVKEGRNRRWVREGRNGQWVKEGRNRRWDREGRKWWWIGSGDWWRDGPGRSCQWTDGS